MAGRLARQLGRGGRRADAVAGAAGGVPAAGAGARPGGPPGLAVARAWDALPALPHHPIALGVAAAAGGLGPRDAAHAAAYLSISGPATAAQRLLAMDPLTVAAVTARLAPDIDAVADRATGELPAATDPLLDLLAEVHAARKDRFFAS